LLSLLGVRYVGGGRVLPREVEVVVSRMWLDNDDMRRIPLLRGLNCFGGWAIDARGRMIKLVGKESELPRVGCIATWQRTTIFLLLCHRLGVGVFKFV
jgi:hypothetical protein